MEKKTLMITGTNGFIGSKFIEKYKKEYSIIKVCLKKNRPEDLDYTGVDVIIHLAALVHQPKGELKENYFEINTELTRRLAKKSKEDGVKHFIFFSTVAVWGTHGYFDHNRIITLETPVSPKTFYAKSKLEAEKILVFLRDKSFEITIIRSPMVYGKNCPGNMKKLEKIVNVFPILPFGNNENKRSIVSIDKLLLEVNEIIKNKIYGIYIPKDSRDLSIKEIVNLFERKVYLYKMPIFIIKILEIIKPNMIKSLYGSLRFGGNNVKKN